MARRRAVPRMCDLREPMHPWQADHLYVGDDGTILCGSCMGVESTYRPWCWSDLGTMGPTRSISLGPIEVGRGSGSFVTQWVARCENDLSAIRPEHG